MYAIRRRLEISRAASLAVALILASRCVAAEPDAARDFFEREVRPVLVESCFPCHGEKKQWNGLRLDSREAMLRGGESGPAIAPGKPAESLLVAAVRQEGELQMPPESKLTDPQIAALTRWIEIGAPWPATPASLAPSARAAGHWAFQPVRQPPLPRVDGADAPARHPIDAFIAARLATAGLIASPPADRRTLLRRVTMDMTGLLPTPEEVAAFERDDDPLAYEHLVDRLLASPHYGEQWGRHWLDVARYSDTKGYVYAREERFWVHAWAYRDWVVRALNDDLPYDRFLLLQIAADQAAADDPASWAAMGFLTLGRRFLGVTHDIIDDRIDVVTRGTMALTVGCARCHDHKFDPIPTRDYYSLYGVFQSCAERLVPTEQPDLSSEAYRAFAVELQARQQKYAETLAARRTETAARVRARVGEYLTAQFELPKYPEEGFDQILAPDDILPAFVRRWQARLAQALRDHDPAFVPWHAYAAIAESDFARLAPDVILTLRERSAEEVNPLVVAQFLVPPASMREVAERYGQLLTEIDRQWRAALQLALDEKRPPPDALPDAAAEALRRLLYGPDAPCEVPDEPIVHTESFFTTAACEELWRLHSEVDRWLIRAPESPPYALVLLDRPTPVTPRVLRRGNPANKGDAVPRQFLELLAGADRQPFAQGSGRLELAQAIIDPRNPLTARVLVNRVWMHHFGTGLVRTPSDFGTRAEPPSHPELLDWLAARFMADGWSLKRLHRLILLSDAYRRNSAGPSDADALARALQTDPDNRLLWRMNSHRLTFEELRDGMLAMTHELDRRLGGKAEELLAPTFRRRSLYGLVDRQFLSTTLRVFDFANPDLHIPQRSQTIVPQQALFFLNHRWVVDRARRLAGEASAAGTREDQVQRMFQAVYQRSATPRQLAAALELVSAAEREAPPAAPPTVAAWQYGYGEFDESAQRVVGFQTLPHFTGQAWQGGAVWPDPQLGWVQLTAAGGHAGNDRQHAAVRRWVAPRAMTIAVDSELVHETPLGDGVRGFLVSSRHGLLHAAAAHHSRVASNAPSIAVQAGDTLDFVVDIKDELNNDQFTWEAAVREIAAESQPASVWNSRADFVGQPTEQLEPWEQLAQMLLAANEFLFVD